MASIEGFLAYARIDEEDPSAQLCYDAAISDAAISGVPPMEGVAAYDLLIYALALHYFENRGFSPGMAVDGRTQDGWVQRKITAFIIKLGLEAQIKANGGGSGGDP